MKAVHDKASADQSKNTRKSIARFLNPFKKSQNQFSSPMSTASVSDSIVEPTDHTRHLEEIKEEGGISYKGTHFDDFEFTDLPYPLLNYKDCRCPNKLHLLILIMHLL